MRIMAEIVQEAPVDTSGVGASWDGMMSMIATYWWVLLLIGLIILLIVVVLYLWRQKEENDRRRDSAVYATAMNLMESCEVNARSEWIRNYYSLWNLLWLGIPFKRNEHSVRILDIDRNLLGWYRGHCLTQDGNYVFLIYKTKSLLGLMEDKFMLYCPMQIHLPKMLEKEGKRVPVKDKNGNFELVVTPLPPDVVQWHSVGEEWIVKCNTLTRQGNYYRFPSYVSINPNTQMKEHIDMTYELSQFIAKQNFIVLAENTFSDMSRAMGKGIELNPHLRIDQKTPEKEKNLDGNDGSTPSAQ